MLNLLEPDKNCDFTDLQFLIDHWAFWNRACRWVTCSPPLLGNQLWQSLSFLLKSLQELQTSKFPFRCFHVMPGLCPLFEVNRWQPTFVNFLFNWFWNFSTLVGFHGCLIKTQRFGAWVCRHGSNIITQCKACFAHQRGLYQCVFNTILRTFVGKKVILCLTHTPAFNTDPSTFHGVTGALRASSLGFHTLDTKVDRWNNLPWWGLKRWIQIYWYQWPVSM